MPKAELAAYAAGICRARQWLPAELRAPDVDGLRAEIDTKLPRALPSLADAMADALAADGEDLDAESLAFDPQTPEDAIALFLSRECLRDDERYRIKAQVVFEAWQDRMPQAVVDLLPSMREFGTAIAAAGINKKRLSGGVHYLGLDLKPVPSLKQAAE